MPEPGRSQAKRDVVTPAPARRVRPISHAHSTRDSYNSVTNCFMIIHAVVVSALEGELLEARTSSVPVPQQLTQCHRNEMPNKGFWGE